VVIEGTVNVGATVSTLNIVCTSVAEFPHASVTIHVLKRVSLKGLQSPFIIISLKVTIGSEQSSVTSVGSPVEVGDVSASHSIVTSPGVTKEGAIISCVKMV
jgi:hypothetical protein